MVRKERRGVQMEKTIGAYEARRRFGQLIEEAYYRHDHFIVERSGRPMAAIVPIADYEKWQKLAKARLFSLLEDAWERNAEAAPEALEQDVDAALKQLRGERQPKEGA